VVRDVSGNRVRQRIYGNRIPAGDTAARPSVIRQIAEKCQGSLADFLELPDTIAP